MNTTLLTKPKKHWPRWPWALGLLLCGGLGWQAWQNFGPLPVNLVSPRQGEAIEAIYATGIVEAVEEAEIGAVSAGRVQQVLVDIGAKVAAGDVLILLENTDQQQRLQEAEARLQLAKQEVARFRPLEKRGFATTQTLQQAQRELREAEAATAVAQKALADRQIVAPFAGYIMERLVDVGVSVSAGQALLRVANTEKLRLVADVDERDIPRVQSGAEIQASADAFPGQVFASTVSTIKLLGDTRTRTYRVEGDLPTDTPLFAGMTVDINVVLAKRQNALLLPSTALVRDPPQGGVTGQAYVWLVENNVAEKKPVTIGVVGPRDTEVSSGLPAEATVIDRPPPNLSNGRRVTQRPNEGG